MTTGESAASAMSVEGYLDRVRRSLPAGSDLSLSPADQRAILEVARVAAHASERIAAPLATFLAGVALGGSPPAERSRLLTLLVSELEHGR